MAQLKQPCYSCSNVAILSISVGGVFREVCGSCYALWQGGHKQNRTKGASMLCYDGCGRSAVMIMPQPTVGPRAGVRYGTMPMTQDVAVCSECADVRRLENLDATNPGHHPQGSQAEAMLERLANDSDDFRVIPGPNTLHWTPSSTQAKFYNRQPLCPQCGVGMGQSANTIVWRCPQCGVQVFFTP